MKFALIFVLVTNSLIAQNRIEDLLKLPIQRMDMLNVVNSNSTMLIHSNFANEDVRISMNLDNITTLKVYYVYTQYKLNPDFDQKKLNQDRFRNLYRLYPELFNNELIEWEIIEQTGCETPEEGDDYFHGFVLVHRPEDTEDHRTNEIERLESFFNGGMVQFEEEMLDPVIGQIHTTREEEVIPTDQRSGKNGFVEFPEGEDALYEHFQNSLNVAGDITINREDYWVPCMLSFSASGKLENVEFQDEKTPDHIRFVVQRSLDEMPMWKPAVNNGESVASSTQLDIRVCYDRALNGIYFRDGRAPKINLDRIKEPVQKPSATEMIIEIESAKVRSPLQENALYKGMESVQPGKKRAVVMDVTGSMATYVATLGIWLKKNPNKLEISSYTFFNDGDTKRSTEKVIGRTGGMYTTDSAAFVVETIVHAMRMGGGGEPSECDIEAIIHAIRTDPEAESILFIGDNYSDIRDLSLLNQVNKPVDILLCAVKGTVKTDYLEIAKKTGGILIVEKESYDLSSLEKGDEIKILKRTYKFKGEKFVLQKD